MRCVGVSEKWSGVTVRWRRSVYAISRATTRRLPTRKKPVGLSQILLAVEGTGAVVIFSVVGALVLGGATLIALAPWDRGSAA